MLVAIPRLAAAVQALILVALVGPGVLGTEPARPNVLLLFADDQRADTIARLGQRAHPDAEPRPARSARVQLPRQLLLRLEQRGRLRAEPGHADEREDLVRRAARPRRGEAPAGGRCAKGGYATFATGKWHNGEPSLVRAFPEPGRSSSAAWPTTPRSRWRTCATARSTTVASRRSSPASSSPTRRSTSSDPGTATSRSSATSRSPRPHDPRNPARAVPGDVLQGSPAAPGELPARNTRSTTA